MSLPHRGSFTPSSALVCLLGESTVSNMSWVDADYAHLPNNQFANTDGETMLREEFDDTLSVGSYRAR
jgi:hypothetical protein